ncbi:hypothetical protein [Nonomuraea sp. GTA35]|uniref:hypothetical protein n=1 Tax=Nonomuraea sp. GTA35 TaxID=1676746 RepID=UPI0035C0715B
MTSAEEEESPPHKKSLMKRFLTIPVLIVTTVLTTAISWGATTLLTRVSQVGPQNALAISLETDPAHMSGVGGEGRLTIIPGSVRTKDNPGQGCAGFHSWAAKNSGIDGGQTTLRVYAQGRSEKAAVITGININVLEKGPPSQGIPASCPTAGEVTFRTFTINLDVSPPKISYDSNSGAPFSFTLAKGETEAFTITAISKRATYRWALSLNVLVEGEQATVPIGSPTGFTTTAFKVQRYWEWDFHTAWTLVRADGKIARPLRLIPSDEPLPPLD